MKKLRWTIIGYIVLLILAGVLLFRLCTTTNQAMPSFVLKTEFVGEYSQGGSEWKPLEKNTRFSSFDGDLVLRGHFSEQLSMWMSFYLDHIGVTISVNGEELYWSGRVDDDVPEMVCGSDWRGWECEGIEPEDEIEIRLHNSHAYGNANAYNEFLNSMYLGGDVALQRHLRQESMPYQVVGVFLIVVSVVLFGMALGYFFQRLPYASLLWSIGMMSLFMGGYILLDTIDICFHSDLIVFNTCMRKLCIMFGALELMNSIRKNLAGKERKMAGILVAILAAVNGILLILSIADVIDIYDTGLYWAVAQGIVALVLFGFCIYKLCQNSGKNRMVYVSYMILLLVGLLELVNARVNWWTNGIVVKVTFVLIFVLHLVRAVKMVAVNHRESARAKELAGELRNSRIVLAMSQIRTHFIFNVLTAISGMCEYDPRKADETLIKFSRYLRSNIDIMQEDEPEPFTRSLEHLEDYIALEQLRFGEKIRFVKDLEVTDFVIPPLILQPVVENSIKHGLLPKPSGGTIELCTRMKRKNVVITITDDGVGCDMEAPKKEGSGGISNVQFRLKHMMNGRMDVDSSPGKGTKVTITIPRKEAVE